MQALGQAVEAQLGQCLKSSKIPDSKLVEMIAVLKVKAIETSISACFKLKQEHGREIKGMMHRTTTNFQGRSSISFYTALELGSYALMGGTGFEKLDYLQCCKFAEGDSRILMQKLTRDRLQDGLGYFAAFAKSPSGKGKEAEACMKLGMSLKKGGKAAWNENFELVYGLADMIMERTIDEARVSG
eukprot:s7015_g1.t1